MGTCPQCQAVVTHVTIGDVTISSFMGKPWRGIKYFCPACGCVLSVQIDPIAIKTDIVEEILHAFGKA